MTDDMVTSMFPTFIELLTNQAIVDVLTVDQKRKILEGLDVHVEEIDDSHIRLGMLFVVLDVDISDPENPKLNMSMDLNALMKLSKN